MKLYSGPVSMFGAKAQIAVAEKGLAHELVMVPFNLWGQVRYDPLHPEVVRVNPKGQVPVLVDGQVELFDSTQIFEYLEDLRPTPPLWPSSIRDRATARMLELKADEVFFPHFPRALANLRQPNEAEAAAIDAGVDAYYRQMEKQLAGREYLAGAYSYADIAFFMAQFFMAVAGRPMPDDLPELNAWRRRVAARPAVSAVAGAVADYLKSNGAPAPAYAA